MLRASLFLPATWIRLWRLLVPFCVLAVLGASEQTWGSVIVVIANPRPERPNPYPTRPPLSDLGTIAVEAWSSKNSDGSQPQIGDVTLTNGQRLKTMGASVRINGQPVSPNDAVRLEMRWFWENTPVTLSNWLTTAGSQWGHYRVEVWDVGAGYGDRQWAVSPWYWHATPTLIGTAEVLVDALVGQPHPQEQAPAFITQPESLIVVPEGAGWVDLNTVADASEPFRYEWWFKTSTVGTAALLPASTSLPGNQLRVINGSHLSGDGQLYYCRAYNSRGSATTRMVQVRKAWVPQLSGKSGVLARAGETLARDFGVFSSLPATYRWTGPAGDRIAVRSDGQLEIADVRMSDGGTYTLTAVNAEGSKSLSTTLCVVEFTSQGHPLVTGHQLEVRTSHPVSGNWIAPAGFQTASNALYSVRPLAQGLGSALRFESIRPGMDGEYQYQIYFGDLLYCAFAVETPQLAAALPELVLPDGMIGLEYASLPPQLPENYLATAISYTATGLPRGLRLNARTGEITGRPLVSGSFVVKFQGINAHGRSAVMSVPLRINTLPEGVAGRFVLWARDNPSYVPGRLGPGAGYRLDLTVAANGECTGRLQGQSFRTWITGSAAALSIHGSVNALSANWVINLPGAEGHVEGRLSIASSPVELALKGWRETKSTTVASASGSAGRYTFTMESSLPDAAGLYWSEQGTVNGTCTVAASGATTVVTHAPVSTTTAFLGPQGEVLCLRSSSAQCAELLIHADGSLTSAPLVATSFCYSVAPELYHPGFAERQVPHPYPLLRTTWFSGRRYTAPAASSALLPLTKDAVGVTQSLQAPGYTSQPSEWTVTSGDKVRLASALAPRLPVVPLSLVFNRATGEYSGRLKLVDFIFRANNIPNLDAILPFHGVLIQQADGTIQAPGACVIELKPSQRRALAASAGTTSLRVELR